MSSDKSLLEIIAWNNNMTQFQQLPR